MALVPDFDTHRMVDSESVEYQTKQMNNRRKQFGEWLALQREKAGYTQQEAADRAKLSRIQYARIELGKTGTKRETLPAIAQALSVDEDECLERAGFLPIASKEPPDVQFGIRLHRIINRLPPIQRQKVEAMLEKDAAQYVSLLTI